MKTAHDLVMAAKARTQEVSLDDADEAIRDADVLIDVREADEFAAGRAAKRYFAITRDHIVSKLRTTAPSGAVAAMRST